MKVDFVSFRAHFLIALTLLALSACGRRAGHVLEVVYVSAPQAILRDRMAAVYNKTGVVKNGDRLEVLEKDRRFVRVRTEKGEEGWLEQRYVATQQIYDSFEKLARQEQNDPVQAIGTTRNDTNLHVAPGRDTEHLYQLNEGSKITILKRATVEKNPQGAAPKPPVESLRLGKTSAAPMEDWWLVRDAQNRLGWVLARMVDVDVPMDVAQYAEGQRIVAFFVLNQVNDGDKQIPQYLVVLNQPRDGQPVDFDQVRVFTWNVRRHRYETAYREHGLNGLLPVTVTHENFEKEGNLPVFVLHVKDENGNVTDRKYKMNTPIVRRVLAPGEEKTLVGTRASARRKR